MTYTPIVTARLILANWTPAYRDAATVMNADGAHVPVRSPGVPVLVAHPVSARPPNATPAATPVLARSTLRRLRRCARMSSKWGLVPGLALSSLKALRGAEKSFFMGPVVS